MRVERPRGHQGVVAGLWRAAAEGRLPHALAFEGRAGTGRFLAAQWLAAGLLCERGPGEPCGACPGCAKVRSGGWRSNHADLFVVDEAELGEERIRVGRIAYRPDAGVTDPDHCLERFFPLKPLEGVWRVALVREAHRMLPAAQNALLKLLEEPPAGGLLVLETSRPDLLLETIQSRCVRVRLGALPREDTRAILAAAGLDPGEAAALSRWSAGSPGEALRLSREGASSVRAVLARVLAGDQDPWTAARALWELEGDFPGDTPRRQARSRARAAADLALAVLGDVLRCAAGRPPEALRHGDLAQVVAAGAPRLQLRRCLEAVLLARGDVDANLAPDAVVDRVLVGLASLGPTGRPAPPAPASQ